MPRSRAQGARAGEPNNVAPPGLEGDEFTRRAQRKAPRGERRATMELEHHKLWERYQMKNATSVLLIQESEAAASVAV